MLLFSTECSEQAAFQRQTTLFSRFQRCQACQCCRPFIRSMGLPQAPAPSTYGWTVRSPCSCILSGRTFPGVSHRLRTSAQTCRPVKLLKSSCRCPSKRSQRLVKCQADPPKVRKHSTANDPLRSCWSELVMKLTLACRRSRRTLSHIGGSCLELRSSWQGFPQQLLMDWP